MLDPNFGGGENYQCITTSILIGSENYSTSIFYCFDGIFCLLWSPWSLWTGFIWL